MALKKLLNKKKADELRKTLSEISTQEADFLLRKSELEKREAEGVSAFNELTDESTTEELEAVEAEAAAIEAEKEQLNAEMEELEAKKSETERQIAELEAELDQEPPVAARSSNITPEVTKGKTTNKREENDMKSYETRKQMLERLDREEVRGFYTEIAESMKEKRAITGGNLTIPEVIVDVILLKMGDYAKVKPLVNTVQLNGTGRVILDGSIPEGIWVECCGPLQELSLSFTQVELDCYKVGGFVRACNALLEDSLINLANYIEDRIAKAIAKAVDKAILVGTGSTGKQPTGIVPAVTQKATPKDLKGLMAAIGMIDDGDEELGTITAVMKRATYYAFVQPETLLATSAGQLAMQNANSAVLPDGTPVVFSQYMPANQVLIGDYMNGYILGERKGITLSASEHREFIEDNTLFKGIARYDGTPVNKDLFVLATMTPGA